MQFEKKAIGFERSTCSRVRWPAVYRPHSAYCSRLPVDATGRDSQKHEWHFNKWWAVFIKYYQINSGILTQLFEKLARFSLPLTRWHADLSSLRFVRYKPQCGVYFIFMHIFSMHIRRAVNCQREKIIFLFSNSVLNILPVLWYIIPSLNFPNIIKTHHVLIETVILVYV